MPRRTWMLILATLFALVIAPVSHAAAADHTIAGTIVDGYGDPVSGTVVQLWDSTDQFLLGSYTSGGDGSFILGPVPDGNYLVELHAVESDSWYAYTSVTVAGADITGLSIHDTFVPRGPGHFISGWVINPANERAGGIFVQLWSGDDVDLIDESKTDANGVFEVGPVPDGDYVLELWDPVVHQWYDYHYGTVAGADVTDVEMHANASPTTSIRAVSDLTGSALQYATVKLERGGVVTWTTTGIDGMFQTQSSYDTITVSARGHRAQTFAGVVSGSNIEARLALASGWGVVSGDIWDSGYLGPVLRDWGDGITVDAYYYDQAAAAWYYDTWVTSDPDGGFDIATTRRALTLSFFDGAQISQPHLSYGYEWWKDAGLIRRATPAPMTLATSTPLPEPVMLDPAFAVTGTVSGPASWTPDPVMREQYVAAWLYNDTAHTWQWYSFWGAPGTEYALAGMHAGEYKLSIHTILLGPDGKPKISGGRPVYTDAWYKAGAAVPFSGTADALAKVSLADTVSVGATETLGGIDFVLPDPPSSKVTRVNGPDRYSVAANAARAAWDRGGSRRWEGVTDVIIANGEYGKEADPLTAAGLSGAYDAPLLLTQSVRVPAVTRAVIAEIARKNPGVKVHIVGGPMSVPDARWSDIRAIPGVSPVKDRLTGADRYEVSVHIAERVASRAGGAGKLGGVLVVAADNPAAYFDALAAGPLAYQAHMPMLAVKRNAIPPVVWSTLGTTFKGVPRTVVSGPAYISEWVRVKVGSPTRLTDSPDRYAAASEIASSAVAAGWTKAGDVAIAAKLPDSLAGGAMMGKFGGVVLFTGQGTSMPTATSAFVTTHRNGIGAGWVLGGPLSVSLSQELQLGTLLQ